MPHPLLTPSATFNRSAILRRAWSRAKADFAHDAGKPNAWSLRQCFASALRYVWDEARGARSYALWAAEQDANAAGEKARRATLPRRDRQIEDARVALMFAEHNDTVMSHRLVAAARVRLHSFQQAV